MCARQLSVTPPRCADPTHCEPCVRSLYLLPVFQAHIQPKCPECKHFTDNTEAHEPKLTFNRNWLHKRLYLNSSQTQLKITDLKTKIVFPKQWHVRAGFSWRQICLQKTKAEMWASIN